MNKRKLGRPLKANLRHRDKAGWIELLFNPRNRFESAVSSTMRSLYPYIAYFTYRFHVEKSREIGISIEDFYN